VEAAKASGTADLLAAAIVENVRLNVVRLRGESHILSEAASSGDLVILGGVYELSTGRVDLL
jgi:carbonic anhydrase